MDIRLVTTSFNDEVHGTYNEKKTGCGINLLKSENVTRYRRGGIMTDLGEITCEKCKTRIAKEMIKADQKEMKVLLKEEKQRAKKGIEDEGIVPLGNTTAKITKQQAPQAAPAPKPAAKPEPEPEKPAPTAQTIPGTGVAIDNSLAQFAINKPQEAAPAHENEAAKPADDFLAQFAINKPQEAPAPEPAKEDDILAQFAVPSPAQPEPAPAPVNEPETPPVIDDISAAIAAMNTNVTAPQAAPVQQAPVQEAAPVINDITAAVEAAQQSVPQPTAPAQPAAPKDDDILSMFSIETPEKQPEPASGGTYDNDSSVIDVAEDSISEVEPEQTAAPTVPENESISEWDLIANQLFGVNTANAAHDQDSEPEPEAPAQEAAPVIDDISVAAEAAQQNAPQPAAPVQEAAPVIDDISAAVEAAQQNAPQPVAPVQEAAPVIDDISAAVEAAQQNVPQPVAPIQEAAPVIDDISAAVEAAQQNVPQPAAPVQETAPVIDDISAAVEAAQQNVPQPAAPVQEAAPVIDDISAAVEAAQQNVPQPTAPVQNIQPIKPAPVKPAPIKPVAPAVQPQAPAPGMPAIGQIISVPQITGYDAAKQPVYAYVQMQITGYGENGQPVLTPVPGQEIPEFEMPFNKNTRLQDAVRAAQEVPTSSREMTPGQRIAAADAARGAHVSANVSKIATNPHAKSTSQAFINAISESKEYANQSLTDTQGLQQRTRVIGSIEDVLSQLGDNSLKQKKALDAQVQQSIPSFQEYKAPTRGASASAPRRSSAPKPAPIDDRPLTKSELKALKKQEKIDAKFRKEMAKRGG